MCTIENVKVFGGWTVLWRRHISGGGEAEHGWLIMDLKFDRNDTIGVCQNPVQTVFINAAFQMSRTVMYV